MVRSNCYAKTDKTTDQSAGTFLRDYMLDNFSYVKRNNYGFKPTVSYEQKYYYDSYCKTIRHKDGRKWGLVLKATSAPEFNNFASHKNAPNKFEFNWYMSRYEAQRIRFLVFATICRKWNKSISGTKVFYSLALDFSYSYNCSAKRA